MTAQFPAKFRYLFEPHRYKIAYGGRATAKSWAYAQALVTLAAAYQIRALGARETMNSIKESVHLLLADWIARLEMMHRFEIQKDRILSDTGSIITYAGLRHNVHNIKSLESYDICYIEEAQTTSHDSWETLIPTLRKSTSPIWPNGTSEIWACYNPMLDSDDTHKRFVIMPPPPGAKVVEVSWRDNPWFPEVLRPAMEHLKATDPEEYEHVYEGKTRSTVHGAIFGEQMKKARKEGRICLVPYDKTKPVDTVWDLGFQDLTAIWFVQQYGGYYNFIDYEEGSGLEISDYIIKLQNRGYVYGTDWLPFDGVDTIIHNKLAGGTREMSIEMLMRAAARKPRMVPKVFIGDRINAGRAIFDRCRFDERKCLEGISALQHFQWGLEDIELSKPGMPVRKGGKEPLHNWASHAAEAFTRAGQLGPKLGMPEAQEEPYKAPDHGPAIRSRNMLF